MLVNGSIVEGDDNQRDHQSRSEHGRNSPDVPIDTHGSDLSESDSGSGSGDGSDSLNGRTGALSVIAEGSEESSVSSSSAPPSDHRVASDSSPEVHTTLRSIGFGGGLNQSSPDVSACDLSRGPFSGVSRASALAAASPVLGIEMSYPLPGNAETVSLSKVQTGDPRPAITSGRQQGLQAGPFPSARVAVCERSAPSPSAAAALPHSTTTSGYGTNSRSRGGRQSLSGTGAVSAAAASAAGEIVARATSGVGLDVPVPPVKSDKEGVRSVGARLNNNGCSSTAPRLSRAKQDPVTHFSEPTLSAPLLATNTTVRRTPAGMRSMFSGMKRFELHGTHPPNTQRTTNSPAPIHADFRSRLGYAKYLRRVRNVRLGYRRPVGGVAAVSTSSVLEELDMVRTAIKQDTSKRISAIKTEQMAVATEEQSSAAAAMRTATCGERQKTPSTEGTDRPKLSARGGRREGTRYSSGARDCPIAIMVQTTRDESPLPLSVPETNAGRRMRQSAADKNTDDAVATGAGIRRASQSTLIGTDRVGKVGAAKESRDGRARGFSAR